MATELDDKGYVYFKKLKANWVKQEVEVAGIKALEDFLESEYFTCQASRCRSKYGGRLFERLVPIYYRVIMLSSRAKIKRHNTSW